MIGDDSGELDVIIVGGGFSGLSAAYELSRAGWKVLILESDAMIGGLASAFAVEGQRLERFYHHWFTSDRAIMDLVGELGLEDAVMENPTRTGLYYAGGVFDLSTPLDVLRFKPLGWIDRVRLGLMVLRARRVDDWRALEQTTAAEWLCALGGRKVYEVVWEPLLRGKFGPYADVVSAVWFWNKIKLRGGSRGRGGRERLAYMRGGFIRLAEAIGTATFESGGRILTGESVRSIRRDDQSEGWEVWSASGKRRAKRVLVTTAPAQFADMIDDWADSDYVAGLREVDYLANICLILRLDRSLSELYWLNVNDPDFPYVGVIEHTHLETEQSYGGEHIIYLSKYLPPEASLYRMEDDAVLAFSIPHIKRMFPDFQECWIQRYHVWRARWAQPVVVRGYSRLLPAEDTRYSGLHFCSMAQIYPEDRGTNHAVRNGRAMGVRLGALLSGDRR